MLIERARRCTRCTKFYDSRAVYAPQELTRVAGTRVLLCQRCAQFLASTGHIVKCPHCLAVHSRGHRTPGCDFRPQAARTPAWAYVSAPHGCQKNYVVLWQRCKLVRAAEIAEGSKPQQYQFGYGNFKTVAQFLRDTRQALHRRINLKDGIDPDALGRKAQGAGCPQRLRGYLTKREREDRRQRELWLDMAA